MTGTLVNSNGTPAKDVGLSIYTSRAAATGYRTFFLMNGCTTDERGHFVFRDLPRARNTKYGGKL